MRSVKGRPPTPVLCNLEAGCRRNDPPKPCRARFAQVSSSPIRVSKEVEKVGHIKVLDILLD